jgi:hypothetical protein
VKALALLCAAALAASAAVTASAATHSTRSVTLHLVEKDVGFNFIDNPPHGGQNKPPSIGDQLAFTANVLTKSGKRAGHLEATCTVTRGGKNGYSACFGVMALAGGELSLMTIALTSENGANKIAIVGGTGAYEGASGSIHSVPRGPNSNYSDDTVHLIPPSGGIAAAAGGFEPSRRRYIYCLSGRIAQRESARFTRGRSLVQSQVRPSRNSWKQRVLS